MSDATLPRSGEAHVWHVRIDLSRPVAAAVLERLHPTEAERAHRHRSDEARARYATVRAALRRILARHAGCAEDEIVLRTSEHGKPSLHDRHGIHFSVSHARDAALVAISDVPIGVDMEYVRPLRLERTASRVLHADTLAVLRALPEARRLIAFFDAWTQREAHVKAVGGGLFRTPDTLPFVPDIDADTVRAVTDRVTAETWSVARISAGAGMRASLVAHGALDRIINLEWDGEPS